MARPRVFVSSTFYDLRHIRASLDIFVRSLGCESVLSEKGDIAYSFDRPLDESCYSEVANADIFVLIIGGRYGAAASDHGEAPDQSFYERYTSITKKEYDRAVELDLPIYVLVEKAAYAEYQTFTANRSNESVNYAHVDSVNVFLLLEEILAKPRNNPVHTFERSTDIEDWLRDQWAGLFRDLLKRTTQQQQLKALSEQVSEMSALNGTLKKYMETLVTQVAPDQSSGLISSEEKRLSDLRLMRSLASNNVVAFLTTTHVSVEDVIEAIDQAKSTQDLDVRLRALYRRDADHGDAYYQAKIGGLYDNPAFISDINEVRDVLDRTPLPRRKGRRSRPSE